MLTRRRMQSTLLGEELPLRCCFDDDGARTRDALLHKSAATYCEVICHYRMFH